MAKPTRAQRSAAAKRGAVERQRHQKAEKEAARATKASAAARKGAVTRKFNELGYTAPGRHDFKRRGKVEVGSAEGVFQEVFGEAEDTIKLAEGYEAYWKTLYTGRRVDPDTDELVKPAVWVTVGREAVVDVDKAYNLGRSLAVRYDDDGSLSTGYEYRVELREILVRVYVHEVGEKRPDAALRREPRNPTIPKKATPSSTASSTSKPPRSRQTKKSGTRRGKSAGATRASSSGVSSKAGRSKRSGTAKKKR